MVEESRGTTRHASDVFTSGSRRRRHLVCKERGHVDIEAKQAPRAEACGSVRDEIQLNPTRIHGTIAETLERG